MKSKVHSGPVRQLQFDATKVVSCGSDGVIAVTDLTTGECTMTLRGHAGAVLAVAFDRSKILSAGDDRTLRTWVWGTRGPKEDKYVVMGPGDNLGRVAKQHGTTVADIVKWNGIRDTRQIGIGTRIIVRKGNPDQPTAAEIEATKSDAAAKRRAQHIEGSRAKTARDHGGDAGGTIPDGGEGGSNDPATLVCRLGKKDAPFTEMWREARRLETVPERVDSNRSKTVVGRVQARLRAMAEEAAAFEFDSDQEGLGRGEGDKEEEEEDVLGAQVRENEGAAQDVSGALLGVVVGLLIRTIVRDAIASVAPRQGIAGRLNAFNLSNKTDDPAIVTAAAPDAIAATPTDDNGTDDNATDDNATDGPTVDITTIPAVDHSTSTLLQGSRARPAIQGSIEEEMETASSTSTPISAGCEGREPPTETTNGHTKQQEAEEEDEQAIPPSNTPIREEPPT